MSVTHPDVVLDNLSYQNINAITGIAVGTKIIIQFKATGTVRVQLSPTQPSLSSLDGVQLNPTELYVIDPGSSVVWVRGTGRLSVQVV